MQYLCFDCNILAKKGAGYRPVREGVGSVYERRVVPGKIISRSSRDNNRAVDFIIDFYSDVTKVSFNDLIITFHVFDCGQSNSGRLIGFQMFNAWLRTVTKLDYLKLIKASRLAGISSYTDNRRGNDR